MQLYLIVRRRDNQRVQERAAHVAELVRVRGRKSHDFRYPCAAFHDSSRSSVIWVFSSAGGTGSNCGRPYRAVCAERRGEITIRSPRETFCRFVLPAGRTRAVPRSADITASSPITAQPVRYR